MAEQMRREPKQGDLVVYTGPSNRQFSDGSRWIGDLKRGEVYTVGMEVSGGRYMPRYDLMNDKGSWVGIARGKYLTPHEEAAHG